MSVHALSWKQVRSRPALPERDEIIDVVRAVVPPAPLEATTEYHLEARVSRGLVARFGLWSWGWSWSITDGGLITSYSPFASRQTTASLTTEVPDALAEWHVQIATIESAFDEISARRTSDRDTEIAATAITELLPIVSDWTQLEDAWYGTFERILAWYLESVTGDPIRASKTAAAAVGGVFSSWIGSSPVLERTAIDNARSAINESRGLTRPDALSMWKAERASTNWLSPQLIQDSQPTDRDDHLRFIERFDAPRDAKRAARLKNAISRTRELVGQEMTLMKLAEVHQLVVDTPAAFRDADAYAHNGLDRYGFHPSLFDELRDALADASDSDLPVYARAARVYLDVCFFHPFQDGNARAARLALDHVLSSAGWTLQCADPIFRIARVASRGNAAMSLLGHLCQFSGPR